MPVNISNSKYQLLSDIGYKDSIPMPIRATADYQMKSEQQIKESCEFALELSVNKELLPATAISFPQSNRSGFELIIDDEFLIQQRELVLHDCKDFRIIFSDVNQQIHKVAKFFIEIRGCQNFIIEKLDVIGARNIIAISNSNDFYIRKCSVQKAEGYAVLIHNSMRFQITESVFKNNLASAVMIVGESSQGMISGCKCLSSTGYYNFDAAIHLCATSEAITLDQIPEKCHEALSIEEKKFRPKEILIKNCVLKDNRAQGIYLEGAVNCLMMNNVINNNNKEGICFDWGSCYNIFKNNEVSSNGERNNLSNEEIVADFISEYPILKDGSSSMKLAGISIDNGCMNDISGNKITKNYGGGVKLVRTALFNRINGNLIGFNSLGSNKFKPFFYGISAEGLGTINNEFDENTAVLLDFLPSQLNVFSNNVIRGQSIAIHADKISSCNTTVDNLARYYHGLIYSVLFYWRRTFFQIKKIL